MSIPIEMEGGYPADRPATGPRICPDCHEPIIGAAHWHDERVIGEDAAPRTEAGRTLLGGEGDEGEAMNDQVGRPRLVERWTSYAASDGSPRVGIIAQPSGRIIAPSVLEPSAASDILWAHQVAIEAEAAQGAAAPPHEHDWTAGTQEGPWPGMPAATCIAPGHGGAAAPPDAIEQRYWNGHHADCRRRGGADRIVRTNDCTCGFLAHLAAQGAAAPPDPRDAICLTIGCDRLAGPLGGRCEVHHVAAQGAAAPPDPRGNAAIEAIGRIQRSIHMEGRVASDGTLVTTEAIVEEAREAIRDFHDRAARLSGASTDSTEERG